MPDERSAHPRLSIPCARMTVRSRSRRPQDGGLDERLKLSPFRFRSPAACVRF
jgi:hypothetical protein